MSRGKHGGSLSRDAWMEGFNYVLREVQSAFGAEIAAQLEKKRLEDKPDREISVF